MSRKESPKEILAIRACSVTGCQKLPLFDTNCFIFLFQLQMALQKQQQTHTIYLFKVDPITDYVRFSCQRHTEELTVDVPWLETSVLPQSGTVDGTIGSLECRLLRLTSSIHGVPLECARQVVAGDAVVVVCGTDKHH